MRDQLSDHDGGPVSVGNSGWATPRIEINCRAQPHLQELLGPTEVSWIKSQWESAERRSKMV
jgi:hypothetical protein